MEHIHYRVIRVTGSIRVTGQLFPGRVGSRVSTADPVPSLVPTTLISAFTVVVEVVMCGLCVVCGTWSCSTCAVRYRGPWVAAVPRWSRCERATAPHSREPVLYATDGRRGTVASFEASTSRGISRAE